MKKHIAVDIGASSGRLVVGWKENGKIQLKEIYRFENEIGEQNGSCFWNSEKLFEEIINGLKVAKQEGIKRIEGGSYNG